MTLLATMILALMILGVYLLVFIAIAALSMTDDRIEGIHALVLSILEFILLKLLAFPINLVDEEYPFFFHSTEVSGLKVLGFMGLNATIQAFILYLLILGLVS